MVNEIWKSVVGYEGHYEVSNRGRLKSCARLVYRGGHWRRITERIMKTRLGGEHKNILVVVLCKNDKKVIKFIGRMVLEAFIGPCPTNMQCCHDPDRNPANCNLSNVRWDTPVNNCQDRVKHGTVARGETHGEAKLTEKLIRQIRKRHNNHEATNAIARTLYISSSAVRDVLKGRSWKHVK